MSTDGKRLPAEHAATRQAAEEPEPDYEDYVREAIAEGLADIRAGRITPLDQVWKKLGLG